MNAKNLGSKQKPGILAIYFQAAAGLVQFLHLADEPENAKAWEWSFVSSCFCATLFLGFLPMLFYSIQELILWEKIILVSHLAFLSIGTLLNKIYK